MKIIVTFKQHDFESLFLQASIVNQKLGDLNAHAVWLNCLNHSTTEEFYVLHNIFLKFACKRVFITKPPWHIQIGKQELNLPKIFIHNFTVILAISALMLVITLSNTKIPIYFTAFLSFIKFPAYLFHVHAKSIKKLVYLLLFVWTC